MIDVVKVCCVCRKMEQQGQWLSNYPPSLHRVSHVYCPSCFAELMDRLDRYSLQKWNRSVYTVIETGQLLEA